MAMSVSEYAKAFGRILGCICSILHFARIGRLAFLMSIAHGLRIDHRLLPVHFTQL